MGQVVSARNVHTVRFPIICGSANNQLIQDNYAEILQRNGVFYVPDYLANSGGVINVAAEIGQIYDRQDVKTRVGLLSEKLRDVLEIAEKQSITPLAAANMLAEARLQQLETIENSEHRSQLLRRRFPGRTGSGIKGAAFRQSLSGTAVT
jgi:glutamate dehydrogenase/leucine dehydrogenase